MGNTYRVFLCIVLFTVLGCTRTTKACINGYEAIPGVFIEETEVTSLGWMDVDQDALLGYTLAMADSCADHPSKFCNDFVIALIYSGAYQRALDLSTELFELYPEEYNVVITHAVACELNGLDRDALVNLQHAIQLNPQSHKGSEWIHVNILKAHTAHRYDPTPAELIGIDISSDSFAAQAQRPRLDTLLAQLHYQIHDRMYFADKGGDKTFGAMLYAYADLLYLTGYRSVSIKYYEMALEYGYEPATVNRRYQIARTYDDRLSELRNREVLIADAKKKAQRDWDVNLRYFDLLRDNSRLRRALYWTAGITGTVVVLIGLWIWRKRSRRLRA